MPVKAPCSRRSTISISGVCTAPISDITTAPARLARISITRLPNRSASRPQSGAAMPIVTAVEDEKSATHICSSPWRTTPSSCWRK